MTDDLSALDNLRPEVREAVHRTDVTVEMFDTLVTVNRDDYDTIRAELPRLTRENDEWQTRCLQFQTERDKARAELAAIKARIAGSRHAFLGPNMDRITFLADEIGPSGKYALVKVED